MKVMKANLVKMTARYFTIPVLIIQPKVFVLVQFG